MTDMREGKTTCCESSNQQ